jgi:hypothetical protein
MTTWPSPYAAFSVKVSLAGIEPVGFWTKSDLRNHQAIIQPRLYDCLMVTQITLRALAEDDNSEERAILCESGARPGVLWSAS